MAFVSPSSNNSNNKNGVNNAQGVNIANGVNTASSQVNVASSLNIDNLSDVVIYAFLASQPNSTHLVNEDLEQIHPDDLEEIDLKWQMAMLTMRARRFFRNTRRKSNLNGNGSISFDKTKVKCYNCHKRSHFARECRAPRGQDNRSRDVTRKTVPVETLNSSALDTMQFHHHTGLFPPPKLNLSYTGLEELFNEPKTRKSKDKSNDVEPESVRKDSDASIIEDWVSDDEEEKVEKKKVKHSIHRINFVKDATDNNPRETVKNAVNAAKAKAKHKAIKGKRVNVVNASACWGNLKENLQDKGVIDSGCSRHMIRNMSFLTDYEEIDEGYVTFRENPKGGKITGKEKEPKRDYILLPLWTADSPFSSISKSSQDNKFHPSNDGTKKVDDHLRKENECNNQGEEDSTNNTNRVNTVTLNMNAASSSGVNVVAINISIDLPPDPNMPSLEDIGIFEDSHDDEDIFGLEDDFHNLDFTFQVSLIPTTRIYKDHLLEQVIGDLHSAPQTRRIIKNLEEHGLVFRNKIDERGIIIRNKARLVAQELVAQEHTQEEGIDYDEVFTPVAKIEAIRLFLAYASFKDFIVYQMDVNSTFLYDKIEEEVYVCQPPGFEDPDFPDKVYKVEKALYGLHQSPRVWYETLSTYLLDNGFKKGQIDKTLFIKIKKGDILLVQVYVDDIIFGSSKKEMYVKKASTPMETSKSLPKDEDGEEVDVHMYRSMIGSLMYLTSSRPYIMFAVNAAIDVVKVFVVKYN
nr:hypothetical protein [Tanacetum cinerariifolium]